MRGYLPYLHWTQCYTSLIKYKFIAMQSINFITLIGHTGKEPEVRIVGESKVANFSLATTEVYKDKSGDKKEVSQWHSVVAWGQLADVCEKYVHKGDPVYISGKLVYEQYEKEGVKHTVAKIKADKIVLLGSKRSEEPAKASDPVPVDDETNDLPF